MTNIDEPVNPDSEDRGFLLEELPRDVAESIAARDAWRRDQAINEPGLEFIVTDLQRWLPGSTLRVAFLDGSTELHRRIEQATEQISESCNLSLDFGYDAECDQYRSWSESDTEHAAEIRISFDQGGYWSLVGRDAVDTSIGSPMGLVGGRPGQRTMNFGGYKTAPPDDAERTIRHEFLHAVGFLHEHQNMRGPCQNEFRWEDDPGYERTTNQFGTFVTDSQGRRPGIYTYLGGPPNNWSRAKVDHNLRSDGAEVGVASHFDPASIMLYRFPALFYRSNPSSCAPEGAGIDLSEMDKRGLSLLYPHTAESVIDLRERADSVIELLTAEETAPELESVGASGLESLGSDVGVIQRQATLNSLRSLLDG